MFMLKAAFFICAFVCVALFCKKETDGFRIDKILSNLSFHPEWEIKEESEEIKEILKQPFRYLGKGAQSFVFAADDGKTVIKFFRYDHMGESPLLKMLPFERAKARAAKLETKLKQDFMSYKLAYDHLKEETGLLYLHLNKTKHLDQTIELVDKLGISHKLSLDDLEFVVQKRASLIRPSIEGLMENGQEMEAKELISKVVKLLVTRCERGLFDKDPDLFTNFGVIKGCPIQIDPGRFKKDASESDPEKYKEEIIRITDKLHVWLEEKYPVLDKELQKEIHEISR